MPLGGYLSLLRPDGKLILVGAPEKPLPALSPFQLIPGSISIGGSIIVSTCPAAAPRNVVIIILTPRILLRLSLGLSFVDLRDARPRRQAQGRALGSEAIDGQGQRGHPAHEQGRRQVPIRPCQRGERWEALSVEGS